MRMARGRLKGIAGDTVRRPDNTTLWRYMTMPRLTTVIFTIALAAPALEAQDPT